MLVSYVGTSKYMLCMFVFVLVLLFCVWRIDACYVCLCLIMLTPYVSHVDTCCVCLCLFNVDVVRAPCRHMLCMFVPAYCWCCPREFVLLWPFKPLLWCGFRKLTLHIRVPTTLHVHMWGGFPLNHHLHTIDEQMRSWAIDTCNQYKGTIKSEWTRCERSEVVYRLLAGKRRDGWAKSVKWLLCSWFWELGRRIFANK